MRTSAASVVYRHSGPVRVTTVHLCPRLVVATGAWDTVDGYTDEPQRADSDLLEEER